MASPSLLDSINAVLVYTQQGMTIPQAVATAVSRGQVDPAVAQQVSQLAGQVAGGALTVQQAASGISAGASVVAFLKTPLGLAAAALALYLVLR